MRALRPIDGEGLRYDHVIGTGGIGSGMVFSFPDDHTLGRNESRLARLEPFRDYCKQHIILHYVSTLLGYGETDFKTYPIGAVGNDDIGHKLMEEMRNAGMTTDAISVSEKNRTMFSVCYQYPDFSGGNITTNNSACNEVSPEHISDFYKSHGKKGTKGIVLAAPEVPIDTRIELLKQGRANGSLNVAAILSSEIVEFTDKKGFALTDLLSVNRDEALKISGELDLQDFSKILKSCIATLIAQNPSLRIVITDGANGSYFHTNGRTEFTPAITTDVISTAGAGDAFLAGILAGTICGLPLQCKENAPKNNEHPLSTAIALGALVAAMAIGSPHTINNDINVESLLNFVKQRNLTMGTTFSKLFEIQ